MPDEKKEFEDYIDSELAGRLQSILRPKPSTPSPGAPANGRAPSQSTPSPGGFPSPVFPDYGGIPSPGGHPANGALPANGVHSPGGPPFPGVLSPGGPPDGGGQNQDTTPFPGGLLEKVVFPAITAKELGWPARALLAFCFFEQKSERLRMSFGRMEKAFGVRSHDTYSRALEQIRTLPGVEVVSLPTTETLVHFPFPGGPPDGGGRSSSSILSFEKKKNNYNRAPFPGGHLDFFICAVSLGLTEKHLVPSSVAGLKNLLAEGETFRAVLAVKYFLTNSKTKAPGYLVKSLDGRWYLDADIRAQKAVEHLLEAAKALSERSLETPSLDELRQMAASLRPKISTEISYARREQLEIGLGFLRQDAVAMEKLFSQ